jgi:WD40-like Beta Propeller Repeat
MAKASIPSQRRGLTATIGLLCCTLLAIASFAFTSEASAACANESIRKAQSSEDLLQGSTYLPACMAFEMVSPTKKFGQEATELSAFSPSGNRALFKSKAALADTEGLQAFTGDSYVATRTASGWALSPTSPPHEAEIVGGGGASAGGAAVFASDLGSWVLAGCTQLQRMAGEVQVFGDGLAGDLDPLSPLLKTIDDSGRGTLYNSCTELSLRAAADLSAAVFSAPEGTTAYLPEDPRNTEETNGYVAFRDESGEPFVELLARDKDDVVWGGRCGAGLGGGGQIQGAISPDGERIYFSARPAQAWDEEAIEGPPCSTTNPLRILERTATPAGPLITELLPGGPSAPGDDLYQGASQDGSKVFLATPRKLTASDQDPSAEACSVELGKSLGCDLYLYDATLPVGERLIQVSAGGTGAPDPGKGANVLTSIAALSPDGSHVYFAAQGVLTTDPNPEGDTAAAGQPNLYLYERNAANPSGSTSFLGTLASGDERDVWGANTLTGAAYPVPLSGEGDGHVLFFLSDASLTSNDADGTRTDVFRYESEEEELLCISCAPGGPDSEPFVASAGANDSFSPNSNFAQQGRWVSDDGETAAFATAEPLVEEDGDEASNPYLWRDGELAWLPGSVNIFQQLPSVSPGGEQVGFTTTEKLLPQDGDTARDAYLVRVDGGFPNPAPQTICDPLSEGSCQGPPSSALLSAAAATSSFSGPGNQKGKPANCRKPLVKRRGRCVKPKRKARKQAKKQMRAAAKRQGSK